MSDDDRDLLRRYAELSDAGAFAAVVSRHVDAVYSTARRIVGGDAHLAEDVTQQVFTALARQAATVSVHPAIGGWLHRTTRNQAVQLVRAERRRRQREGEALVMMENNELDWRRVGPILDEMIDRLREPDRTAVLLRFFEQRGFSEIGSRLGVSEDAARVRVGRAVDRLRGLMHQHHVRSSSTALALALSSHAVSAAPAGLGAAIASQATAAVGLAGTMAMGKATALAVGAVVLLGTVGFTAGEWQRLQSARNERERIRQLQADSARSQASLADELARLAQTNRRLRDDVQRARAEAAERSRAVGGPAPGAPEAEGREFLARNPEVAAALLAWTDARTEFQWGGLFSQLQMSPEQIRSFKELMRERAGFGSGNIRPGRSLQLSPGTGLSHEEVEHRLKELLGPDGYQAYLAHYDTIAARETAAALASQLALTDDPLTADQATRLVTLLSNHQSRVPAEGMRLTQWDALEAQARAILRDEQMDGLAALRARETFHAAFNQAIRAAAAAGGNP